MNSTQTRYAVRNVTTGETVDYATPSAAQEVADYYTRTGVPFTTSTYERPAERIASPDDGIIIPPGATIASVAADAITALYTARSYIEVLECLDDTLPGTPRDRTNDVLCDLARRYPPKPLPTELAEGVRVRRGDGYATDPNEMLIGRRMTGTITSAPRNADWIQVRWDTGMIHTCARTAVDIIG